MDFLKNKNYIIGSLIVAFILFITFAIFVQYNTVTDSLSFWGFFSDPNFRISFLASAYEDITFFILIGILLFLAGIKKPEDDMLENRINNLFTNNGKVDSFILNKSKEYIKNLAVYSDKTEVNIEIIEKNIYQEKILLKIGLEKTHYFKSLIHDLDNLINDGTSEYYGETCAELPNNIYGMITLLELRCQKDGSITKIVQNEPLKEPKTIFNFKEKFNKDDTVILYSNCWMWMLEDDFVYHTAYKNTANTIISVKNKLAEDIILTSNNGDVKELTKGSFLVIEEYKPMLSMEKIGLKISLKNKGE